MQQAETRALWRAVGILVLVSAGRWVWSSGGDGNVVPGESVLPELLATSREAAADGARRAEPLAQGERVDPNRAPEAELDRLPGVGPATARAIVAAREDGAVFRRPEDLLVVRGIGEATLERIEPALDLGLRPAASRVSASGIARRAASDGGPGIAARSRRVPARGPPATHTRVDLNHAGFEELQSLPGIGPALARRIVVAREEQMFTSPDDLIRVRGIGEATLGRLRPHVSVGRAP